MSPPLRLIAISTTLGVVATLTSAVAAVPATVAAAPTAGATRPPVTVVDKPKGPFVRWDAKKFVVSTDKVRAHGRVPGGKRVVHLQVLTKGTWLNLKSKRSKGNGKFRIAGRLDWYGKHKVRVIAPGRRPFVRATKANIRKPYSPIGNPRSYDLLVGRSVAQNWRFNPCRTLTYRVNIDDVGAHGLTLAKAAMKQISWATGIKVKYAGTSSMIPAANKKKKLPRGTNLVIAWATNVEVPDFVRRSASGFGGPRRGVYARNSHGRRVVATTQAGATLSTDYYYNGFAPSFESTGQWNTGQLLLHEIGHAMGLDHVNDPENLMDGTNWAPWPDGVYRGLLGSGDLKGMSKVGLPQGCLRPMRGGRTAEVVAPPEAEVD